MPYVLFLIPLGVLAAIAVWVSMICHALREEHDYLWVVLLVALPPIGIPLYIVNFYVLGDSRRGLTAVKTRSRREREAATLELDYRGSQIPALQEKLIGNYFDAGKWEKCLEHLGPAINRDPENLRLQYLAARSLLALKKHDAALRHLQYIIEESPRYDTWRAMLLLAQVLDEVGRRDQALKWYEELGRSVTFPEGIYHYARAYWETERRDQVAEVLRSMVENYEKNPRAHPAADRKWVEELRKLLSTWRDKGEA